MANSLNSNPIYADTAATLWDGMPKNVILIQWIDDAADIADDSDLNITINDVTIPAKIQVATTTGGAPVENVTPNVGNVCVWEMGPFNPGIPVSYFKINTIDAGALVIWVQ